MFFSFLSVVMVLPALISEQEAVRLYFSFDTVGLYLVLITVLIGVCVCYCKPWLTRREFWLIMLRQFFAIISYVCVHAFFF